MPQADARMDVLENVIEAAFMKPGLKSRSRAAAGQLAAASMNLLRG